MSKQSIDHPTNQSINPKHQQSILQHPPLASSSRVDTRLRPCVSAVPAAFHLRLLLDATMPDQKTAVWALHVKNQPLLTFPDRAVLLMTYSWPTRQDCYRKQKRFRCSLPARLPPSPPHRHRHSREAGTRSTHPWCTCRLPFTLKPRREAGRT